MGGGVAGCQLASAWAWQCRQTPTCTAVSFQGLPTSYRAYWAQAAPVCPARKRQPLGGWPGRRGEGRGRAHPPLPSFPTQGEDARLEARATLSSQCGLGQLVALSGPQVPLPHNPGASQGSLHADHPVLGTLVPGQGAVRTGGHKRAPELHPTGSQDHEASRWGSGGLGGDLPAGAESLGIGQRYRCPFPGKAFIHNLALFISQQH